MGPYAWLSVIIGGIGEDLKSFNISSLVSSLVPRSLPHFLQEEPGYKTTNADANYGTLMHNTVEPLTIGNQ